MKLFICVDDEMGVGFNKRRQSKDRVLRARMLARANGKNFFKESILSPPFFHFFTIYHLFLFFATDFFIFLKKHALFFSFSCHTPTFMIQYEHQKDRSKQ